MRQNGFEIAVEKTEVLIIKDRRRPAVMELELERKVITPKKHLKYLGVNIDENLTFGPHIKRICEKAEKTINALGRMMPNIGGPMAHKRKAMWEIVNSILLYGAPIWRSAVNKDVYRNMLTTVQRKMLLRTCSAYRTVSNVALQVVAGVPPIHLLVEERSLIHNLEGSTNDRKKRAREMTMIKWRESWRNPGKGAWTRTLIKDLDSWVYRKHGNVTFHVTQALTGHGCFQAYTYKIKKAANDKCMYCPDSDTASHTLFHCSAWSRSRQQVETELDCTLQEENLVDLMLTCKANWEKIAKWITSILKAKETEEHHRQSEGIM